MANGSTQFAWATLITRSSYLAGVIGLAYTLRKHASAYPLIVLYTSSLKRSSIAVLEEEAAGLNLIPLQIQALEPGSQHQVSLIAERFADTWTKLRIFELFGHGYSKVCYLDADMIILNSMDHIFATPLPNYNWLAANHACVCNLDRDAWAPADWVSKNCAYTPLTHPSALTEPTPVTPRSRPTHHLLNSGMFLFAPSQRLWNEMLQFFQTTPKLSEFKFPDQDFLAEFFRGRWLSLGWQYNALKTMRYWHPNIWRDDEVVCLHYIVDKPWAKRVGPDGVAGYLGRDGTTHDWWWKVFEEWEAQRKKEGRKEVLAEVRKYVAPPKREGPNNGVMQENDELKAIGSQVQGFASNKSIPATG